MPDNAPRSTRTYSAGALLALTLFACAGCSNEEPATFTAGPAPRTLSESEVAEIKKTTQSSQQFRKMVRAKMLADENVVVPKKSSGKRLTNKAH
jgi:hypothetical protein